MYQVQPGHLCWHLRTLAKYITAINQDTFDPDEVRMLTQAKITL